MRIVLFLGNILRKIFRSYRVRSWRMHNKNMDFSLMCNNCVGAMVAHDLGVQFNSPTVNLFIYPKDYLNFLENLDCMSKAKLENVTPINSTYPIGSLNGVKIHFLHYKSFEEAAKAWNRRIKRLNYENMYVVLIEREGCTYEDLLRFDNLSFGHKIALTHRDYNDIKCSYKVPGYENSKEVGILTDWDGFMGKRLYDCFDWVNWLNG